MNLSNYICPICNQYDVELYKVNHLQNYYRCQSTGEEVELDIVPGFRKPKPKTLGISVKERIRTEENLGEN